MRSSPDTTSSDFFLIRSKHFLVFMMLSILPSFAGPQIISKRFKVAEKTEERLHESLGIYIDFTRAQAKL